MLEQTNKTIAAISTPLGSSGIGIVRLSGSMSFEIAQKIFRPYNSQKKLTDVAGYSGALGRVFDESGDIDECIAFVYIAPKSYTGENVVELSCHGGVWIIQKVLRLCLENGALPAEPGEFTKRAFLNGKLDLSQAEAVQNLIAANSEAAVRASIAAKDGALQRKITEIVDVLTTISASLAAWADYPDEDLEEIDPNKLLSDLQAAHAKMRSLLAGYDKGKIIFEGINAAIIGKPNVGKSTLMNLLSGHNRSIVTDIPGTTRDIVHDDIRLGGLVLKLHDTAGIRTTGDSIELIGVQKSKNIAQSVDLILAVFDASTDLANDDMEVLSLLKNRPVIVVINKIDLSILLDISKINEFAKEVVYISAVTGEGRDDLEKAILKNVGMDNIDTRSAILSNERQRILVTDAELSLKNSIDALNSGFTFDAVNVEIDYALGALLSLSGENVSDKVIDEVFSRFCVGK